MERPFLLDSKHITVSIKEPVIKWMNALVSLNQANSWFFPITHVRTACSIVQFDGFGRERYHTTEVWTTWIERAAGFAKTRESSKLTSNRTSPKPFGGIGSVKLALNVGVFDRDT